MEKFGTSGRVALIRRLNNEARGLGWIGRGAEGRGMSCIEGVTQSMKTVGRTDEDLGGSFDK